MLPETKAAMERCRVLLANAKTPEDKILWEEHLRRFEIVEKLPERKMARKVVSLSIRRAQAA